MSSALLPKSKENKNIISFLLNDYKNSNHRKEQIEIWGPIANRSQRPEMHVKMGKAHLKDSRTMKLLLACPMSQQSQPQGHSLWAAEAPGGWLLCCHQCETLTPVLTRSPVAALHTGPHKSCSLSCLHVKYHLLLMCSDPVHGYWELLAREQRFVMLSFHGSPDAQSRKNELTINDEDAIRNSLF